MIDSYRGRFAPSPTGHLHMGSLIAALASYADAKAHNGTWLLRIDDIDTPRVVSGSSDSIITTLAKLGFEWDEEIYYQSHNLDIYNNTLDYLSKNNLSYWCGCSRKEVEQANRQLPESQRHLYPGICRKGLAPGKTPRAVRLKVDERVVSYSDLIQGHQQQNLASEVGDYVIYRADGIHAYQLAVVVDEINQGITHVIRGYDLLDSTPRQLALFHLLEHPSPHYGHFPLLTDEQGLKLAKQNHAKAIDVKDPLTALKFAAHFLGQTSGDIQLSETLDEFWAAIIGNWQLARIPKQHQMSGHSPLLVDD